VGSGSSRGNGDTSGEGRGEQEVDPSSAVILPEIKFGDSWKKKKEIKKKKR